MFSADNFLGNISYFNQHITRGAVFISLISIGVLIILQQPFTKKWKVIPAPLLVVALGIVINSVFSAAASGFSLKQTQLVNIPSNIFSEISFPDFSTLFSNLEIWKYGLIIGILATLETLLCVEAVDKLDKHNRITPVNRELIAQGIGNMTCGLLGAIPITAVVVRGAANADAGGKQGFQHSPMEFFYCWLYYLFPFAEYDSLCFSCRHPDYYWIQSHQTETLSKYVESGMETVYSLPAHDTGYSFD